MSPDTRECTVRTISPETTAREAAVQLGQWHVGFLVVVDGERPVGVLTDRDVALRVLARRRNPSACKVADIMTSPFVSLPAGQGTAEASRLMRENAVRKLPIVDAEGRLEGVVTADDIVLSLGQRIHALADAVQRELRNEALPPDTGSSIFGKE